MRGQLLLGTGISQQVVNNCIVHHMLFYLGFYSSPFFITITITFYFVSITKPSLFQPMDFSFSLFPSPTHQSRGEGMQLRGAELPARVKARQYFLGANEGLTTGLTRVCENKSFLGMAVLV